MSCNKPLKAWKTPQGITFDENKSYGQIIMLPCNQCMGCKIDRSREWAVRCIHEASLHNENSFVTLTYSNEYLPENHGLNKSHFQKFIKRLRKRYPKKK